MFPPRTEILAVPLLSYKIFQLWEGSFRFSPTLAAPIPTPEKGKLIFGELYSVGYNGIICSLKFEASLIRDNIVDSLFQHLFPFLMNIIRPRSIRFWD